MSELNRAWWDERVPLHVSSAFYDVEAFMAGRDTLRPFELEEVGDVAGRSPVHLQCHFGGAPRIPLMFSLRARAA